MTTLVIANKCYSSWSLRPWILMRHHGIVFVEMLIPLGLPDTRERILLLSPSGKVPALIEDGVAVWESLAIMETLAERRPDLPIWPRDPAARAHARSIAAEMHAGFGALRNVLPMNLGKRYAHRDRGEKLAADVARVIALWKDTRARFGADGPFLFGADFTAADAMYAPVVTRLDTYDWPVDGATRAYMDAILTLPAFKEWLSAALRETWIVAEDEIDEEAIANFRGAGA
ncbi:MAG: glutathione S-transferase family protein [Salinarimonadaceae bacterium]|nr:MAG: glutathione S-transferase family protein [Salinarimonadaceae bacterium]